jgi:hypothetical protein
MRITSDSTEDHLKNPGAKLLKFHFLTGSDSLGQRSSPSESGSRKNKEKLLLGLSPTTGSGAEITAMKSPNSSPNANRRCYPDGANRTCERLQETFPQALVMASMGFCHLSNAQITKRKQNALIANTTFAPKRGNSTPPIEGPIIPEMFNLAEARPMLFSRLHLGRRLPGFQDVVSSAGVLKPSL